MQISYPNEYGAITATQEEEVARLGRSFAAINFALCDDGLIRYSLDLMYSYGGFASPVWIDSAGYATTGDARVAALEDLLRQWPKAWPSEPSSVYEELRLMREQIQSHLSQPSLF
ncbi:hypothetical protein K2Y11_09685 [bacterium]|nr:hypothetical protein [bacterium]